MKKLTLLAAFCIAIVVLITAGLLWWLIHSYFETGKPTIRLTRNFHAIGQSRVIDFICSDAGSGIRSINATVIQDNKSHPLMNMAYPKRGTKERSFSVTIDPAAMKLREGAAQLRISALDYSMLKNEGILEQSFAVDTRPPLVFLMNPVNNINPGGTCVIVYKTSEPAPTTGVQVGDVFFPGASITLSGKPALVSYFALPLNADAGKNSVRVMARDEAGNQSFVSLPFLLKKKKFRSDKMSLGDNFLLQKMPEFESIYPSLKGKTPLEVFQFVNSQLRLQNEDFIRSVCRTVTPKQLWHDAFLRMKNASPMALFGDRRTYMYQGKAVGESVHQGVDLASTAHAPIEAANDGTVVFTGPLGIYGNAVIIDHGLGLYSLYGHCSAVNAQKGQSVKKGEAVAVSGATGLAAGDHLHFSLLVGGQFVNPQEWWDPHWITDNVYKKMEVTP
jgi:murein DD-endopeptidase MepM/ murein hydrolase activator NlpD